MNSRDESEKTVKVSLPDSVTASVYVKDAMSVEEFLASACARKNLNPAEHFVRVKKRRDMEDHNYFVPHRSDLIETYVSKSNVYIIGMRENMYFNWSIRLTLQKWRHVFYTDGGLGLADH